MAYEIQLPIGTSGLENIYAVGIDASGMPSGNIPLNEIGSTGIYGNSFAITVLTQDGTYTIAAYQGDTLLAMAGPVLWDGTGFVDAALTAYGVAKTTDVQVVIDGGFLASDRNTLGEVRSFVEGLTKGLGRIEGVTMTSKRPAVNEAGYLRSSDGAIDQILTFNPDGSVTIANT